MRNAGLDVARSIAILLVLAAHYSAFYQHAYDVAPLMIGGGYFGVELFFVLSGFLIGRILIRDVLPVATPGALRDFWTRRWLRTLPAYYLVLAGLCLAVRLFFDQRPNAWPHLLFLQNWLAGDVFGVSWSLVIEEWFYLTVPLVAVLLRLTGVNTRNAVLLICLIGIVLCPLGRWLHTDLSWMNIRQSVFIRLDAILYGLLLAWIFVYRADLFDRMRRFALPGIIGLILCAMQFADLPGLETKLNKTVFFSATSVLFVPILAWLEGVNLGGRIASAFTFVSMTSYSVYLIHWDIMQLFRGLNPFRHSDGLTSILMLSCAVVTYTAAYMLYQYWEHPFLQYRDRHSKGGLRHVFRDAN